MSVGFGFSVGDFLAALKLVGTVIDALREASESGDAYRELLHELFALETALLHVNRLELDDGQRTEKIALRQAAAQCQRTIDNFWDKIRKYQPHLRHGGTGSRIKDSWVKIKWAVCKKDDMERFKADLRGHRGAIEVLLLAVQMEAAVMQSRRQDEAQKTLAGKIQELSSQWFGTLSAIADGVNHSVQQGKYLLDATAKIIQTNLRVFQMVFDIHQYILRVPPQVNRQQPVYMIDAFGKESPFHLEFVRSAEALIAILKVNFKSTSSGSRMIERGDFVIEDAGTKRDIDLDCDWDTCFFPGQRVSMSMVFKRRGEPTTSTCPACRTEAGSAADQEVVCDKCGITFRRVREEPSEMPPRLHPPIVTERLRAVKGPRAAEPQPKPQLQRRNEGGDDVDDIQRFRRVRLLESVSRCRLYTSVNGSWYDYGTGLAVRTDVIDDNICIEVHSQHEPGHELVMERVSRRGIQGEDETLLVWTNVKSRTKRALRFQTEEGYMAAWRPSYVGGRLEGWYRRYFFP
ncbi:uncharacterized protein B0H64DRAFT_409510 [Chaetomium fimeti]|uniref:Fungal N-terminal domain-containing protein n=1 Tax=Chaetomium fimeti TaxID=1854472 RepID=A0AAE0H7V5_9PEZI|nr:hypothetical protein B0H64DRAFT_409510 [Chaetomium fimeti]